MFFIFDKIFWAKKMHKLNLFLLLNLNCNTKIELERFSVRILGSKQHVMSMWALEGQETREWSKKVH